MDDDARVIPVNDLVTLTDAPSEYVVVGAGKTATDACLWLLDHDVDPDAICWVRRASPWMLNRAVVQPDPAVFTGMVASTMEAATGAASVEEVFLRLEAAGVMLRLDTSVLPTMAKTPTLGPVGARPAADARARRTARAPAPGAARASSCSTTGRWRSPGDALVVHCAAPGLRYPPLVPIWQPSVITLQPIRTGFPCFGAALAGYVEATRGADLEGDAEKNRLCPPTPFANTMHEWAAMTVRGARASASFGAEPDIRAWADGVALNPARLPPEGERSAALERRARPPRSQRTHRSGALGGARRAVTCEFAVARAAVNSHMPPALPSSRSVTTTGGCASPGTGGASGPRR